MPDPRKVRACIIGDVCGGRYYHLGDEAMFTANVDAFRQKFPNVTMTALSENAEFCERVHGIPCLEIPHPGSPLSLTCHHLIKPRSFFRSWTRQRTLQRVVRRALRDCDVLIISGAGNLASQFKHQVNYKTIAARIAISLGKRVIVLGQTLGPEIDALTGRLLRGWLPDVDLLCLRDRISSPAIAAYLDVDETKILLCPDDAFSLRPSHEPELRDFDIRGGFAILSCYGPKGDEFGLHAKFYAAAVNHLTAKHNMKVVFLPHVRRSTERNDDRVFADLIGSQVIRREWFHVDNSELSDRDVAAITRRAKFVLSSRYHGVVFALAAQKPCLAVYQDEYSRTKLAGALDWTPNAQARLRSVKWPSGPERCIDALLLRTTSASDSISHLEGYEKHKWHRIGSIIERTSAESPMSKSFDTQSYV